MANSAILTRRMPPSVTIRGATSLINYQVIKSMDDARGVSQRLMLNSDNWRMMHALRGWIEATPAKGDRNMTGPKKSLEERLQRLEDQLAIYQLVCGYGYAVDGCNGEAVGSFYSADGSYSVGDVGAFAGREQIAGITANPRHRALVAKGCGSFSTLPYVVIDGATWATATCHTLLIKRVDAPVPCGSPQRFETRAVAQARWSLADRASAEPHAPWRFGRPRAAGTLAGNCLIADLDRHSLVDLG